MRDILRGIVFVGLFAVPFLTLHVANDYFFPFITGKNFLFRIIVEIVVGAWIALALYDVAYRPKFSWVLASFGALIAVMFASSLQAEHASTAIWSNFERMDGFVTLVHVFAYFVVLGTMLNTPKLWSYFLHTSVVVASIVALNGLSQLSTSGGAIRVDSTLGNAAYMAVYMLFHIFFLFYLFVQTRVIPYRIVYAMLAVLFIFVLLQTGTRGTAIGLVTGTVSMVAYLALFGARFKQLQKYAYASFVVLVILIVGFISIRDTSYIQGTPALARIANIDLGQDLSIRTIIWGMSLEGFKERPILGWGQGNFNYVFNEQYDPRLYQQEQWFDRVHNIVFDWLIAGGVLGFVFYASVFLSLLYYLVISPLRNTDNSLSVVDRAIIVGLLVGYVTHNLVVFDNIVSYIFFAIVIALVHSRVSVTWPKINDFKLPEAVVTQIAMPIVLVVTFTTVYLVNIPSMQAAVDIINALQSTKAEEKLTHFETALSRDSFARQEIVEQFAQHAMSLVQSQNQAPDAIKIQFLNRAEEELLKLIADKPGDARLYVFLSSYYRTIGETERAKEAMAAARAYSPKKQSIIIQQGAIELSLGNNAVALPFFKEAYDLDINNQEAKEFYIATLFYNNESAAAKALIADSDDEFKVRLANSDFVVGAVSAAGDYEYLAQLYEARVATDNTNAQSWASLAFVYHKLNDREKALESLTRAKTAVPAFAARADCFSANIKKGQDPQAGCQ